MLERPLSRQIKKLYQKAVPNRIKQAVDFLVNFRKLKWSEQWFDKNRVKSLFKDYCRDVKVKKLVIAIVKQMDYSCHGQV